MDHNPSGRAGGSGRPLAPGPDNRPDQDLFSDLEEAVPRSREAEATAIPAAPGQGLVLDLDAVSDYVPALDYGPVPDNGAARDYGLAIDYDAPHAPALATHRDAPPHLGPAPDSGRATAPAPHPASPPDVALARDPGQALGPAPAPDSGRAKAPAPHPASAPDSAPAPGPAPAWDASGPGPAAAAGPRVSGLAAGGTAPASDPWLADPMAGHVSAATYWRRRMIALAVGIVVLTVLAWTVSGALGGSSAGQGTSKGGQPSAGAHRHAGGSRAGQHHPARHGGAQ